MEKQELINELNAEFGNQFKPEGRSLFDLMWQLLINETHDQPLCLYDVHHKDGYQLAIVKPNSNGYIPTGCFIKEDFLNVKWERAWSFIYALNAKAFDHSEQKVWHMVASSMQKHTPESNEKKQQQIPEDEKAAIMQFVGYSHAKDGGGLVSLIEAMGLTKSEWDNIKNAYLGLSKSEKKQIDNYFNEETVTGGDAGTHG